MYWKMIAQLQPESEWPILEGLRFRGPKMRKCPVCKAPVEIMRDENGQRWACEHCGSYGVVKWHKMLVYHTGTEDQHGEAEEKHPR